MSVTELPNVASKSFSDASQVAWMSIAGGPLAATKRICVPTMNGTNGPCIANLLYRSFLELIGAPAGRMRDVVPQRGLNPHTRNHNIHQMTFDCVHWRSSN